MKRFAALLAVLVTVTGCGSNNGAVSTEKTALFEKEEYNEKVDSILSDRMWNYNTDNIIYTEDIIPNSSSEDYDTIAKVSGESGMDMTQASGKEAVTAQVELYNNDRSSAGTAYIQFVEDEPVCGYYVYNQGEYSLDNKYPFEVPNAFSKKEDIQKEIGFSSQKLSDKVKDHCDIYKGKMAVLNDRAVEFYSYDNGFKFINAMQYSDLMPMDAAITDDFTAVLLGTVENTVVSESSYEVEEEEHYILKSDSIQFIDSDGKEVLPSLELDLSTYTTLAFDNDKLVIGRDKGIDIYRLENNVWVKQVRYSLDHFVRQIRVDDIDNDGSNEYIVADDINIYIYRADNMPQLLWSTNYDVGRLTGTLYVGDLNNDGIKEIYISDNNRITFRYVLIDGGFKVFDGNIIADGMGDYIVGDFDNDGNCDYICSSRNEEDAENYIYMKKD